MRIAALLGVLAAALVLGLAACGGDDAATTTTTVEEPATTAAALVGDPAAGKEVFDANNCGSCHELKAAGSGGPVGPNLDERLVTDAAEQGASLEEFTRQSIVEPDAIILSPYQASVMPTDYGERLSEQELADLVAFLVDSVQ